MFLKYNQNPYKRIQIDNIQINSFINDNSNSLRETKTIKSFGNEWSKFSNFNDKEIKEISNEYFDLLNKDIISPDAVVLDLGGGSGRWSKCLSDKVKIIELVEPSEAIYSATKFLSNTNNVRITHANAENIPFFDETFDFAMCLGVLHHIDDTENALKKLVSKIKMNGYLLIYLYYNFENRGIIFKIIFKLSYFIRLIVSRMPTGIKQLMAEIIAISIYFPLKVLSITIKKLGGKKIYKKIPLSYYSDKSFYIMRNDALDRFGTPIEKRYSKKEIYNMLIEAGVENINFSNNAPYWHCIGQRKR